MPKGAQNAPGCPCRPRCTAARRAGQGADGAVGSDFPNDVVGGVGHIDVAGVVHGHIVGQPEPGLRGRPVAGSGDAGLPGKNVAGGRGRLDHRWCDRRLRHGLGHRLRDGRDRGGLPRGGWRGGCYRNRRGELPGA